LKCAGSSAGIGHLRCTVRNASSFNFRRRPGDIVLALRGPDVVTLLSSLETIRDKNALGRDPGRRRRQHRRPPRQAGVPIRVDRDRAADLGVDVTDVSESLRSWWEATTKVAASRRLRRPGLRPSSSGFEKPDRSDAEDDLAPLRPLVAGRPRPARQRRHARPGLRPVAHRAVDRQRTAGSSRGRPGLRPRGPARGAPTGHPEAEPPLDLFGLRARPRARVRADVQGVLLRVPPLDRLHVHDPRLAVRERDPPGNDPRLRSRSPSPSPSSPSGRWARRSTSIPPSASSCSSAS